MNRSVVCSQHVITVVIHVIVVIVIVTSLIDFTHVVCTFTRRTFTDKPHRLEMGCSNRFVLSCSVRSTVSECKLSLLLSIRPYVARDVTDTDYCVNPKISSINKSRDDIITRVFIGIS